MYNRRYEKRFWMLRQETAGYAIASRAPWGSCILELKNGSGRLQLTVQGLRPLRQPYRVCLLAGEESIFCGTLSPDAREGHAALKWEFAPDAIGNGKRVEDIHTVLILAEYGEMGVSAPLLAYAAEETNWRALLSLPAKATQEEVPIPLQAAEAALLERPTKPIEKVGKAEKPPKIEHATLPVAPVQGKEAPMSYHGSFRGLLAKFRQELEELEVGGVLSPEEVERIRQSGTQSAGAWKLPAPADTLAAKKEAACVESAPASTPENPPEIVPEIVLETTSENPPEILPPIAPEIVREPISKTPSPFAKNRELAPFGDGVGWKCISLTELTLLAQIPLCWQKAFFFLLPQRRYHHLILREQPDGIWLGVPAVYRAQDAADAQQFGFDSFRRVEGEWGYWLTHLEKD